MEFKCILLNKINIFSSFIQYAKQKSFYKNVV